MWDKNHLKNLNIYTNVRNLMSFISVYRLLCILCLQSVTNHDPYSRQVYYNKVWKWPRISARHLQWWSLVAWEHGNYSIHKLTNYHTVESDALRAHALRTVIWLIEVWCCLCWLTAKLSAREVQHYLCFFVQCPRNCCLVMVSLKSLLF